MWRGRVSARPLCWRVAWSRLRYIDGFPPMFRPSYDLDETGRLKGMITKWRKRSSTEYINEDFGRIRLHDDDNGDRPVVYGIRILLDQLVRVEIRAGVRFGRAYHEALLYSRPGSSDPDPTVLYDEAAKELRDLLDKRTGKPKAERLQAS